MAAGVKPIPMVRVERGGDHGPRTAVAPPPVTPPSLLSSGLRRRVRQGERAPRPPVPAAQPTRPCGGALSLSPSNHLRPGGLIVVVKSAGLVHGTSRRLAWPRPDARRRPTRRAAAPNGGLNRAGVARGVLLGVLAEREARGDSPLVDQVAGVGNLPPGQRVFVPWRRVGGAFVAATGRGSAASATPSLAGGWGAVAEGGHRRQELSSGGLSGGTERDVERRVPPQ